MKRYKSYKYYIKPNEVQRITINKIFDCVRFVHNLYVEDVKKGNKSHHLAKDILFEYKEAYPFLNDTDSSALINKLFQLQENVDKENISFAKKKINQSYTTSNLSYDKGIYLVENKYIHIPLVGDVEIVLHRPLLENSRICKATISRDTLNEYYVSVLVVYEWYYPRIKLDPKNSIGLDYSSPKFYVDSNGNSPEKPHFYYNIEERVAKYQKILENCTYGSNNYKRCKDKIAKIYKRSANQRNDFLHKEANRLANKYDIVCVEDISLVDIAHNFNLAKKTYDNAYGNFVLFLKYKLEERGKVLIRIKKRYPSSKICHICNHEYKQLTINDRKWICPNCHNELDRDINAAINIRNEGLRELNFR
ncbi:MAG: RNA-guided endonuclease TnpB family protein [Erysipelotrichaceae bacterium]|nr:RNA-guided endonuclease TnpB family protein [Erysipelotrichaceae bacterium]